MSKTSVTKYVQNLILKGDAIEKDRNTLEEILGDIAKKIDNEKIEDFFTGLDIEKMSNPDLFNSSKGLNIKEIKEAAQKVTVKIQIQKAKENRNNHEKISDQTIAKFIMDNTKENEPIEVIVNKISEIYPGLSPKSAEIIGRNIQQARNDRVEIEQMRNNPENANLSDKELIEKKFENNRLDMYRYVSSSCMSLRLNLDDLYKNQSGKRDSTQIFEIIKECNVYADFIPEDIYKKYGYDSKQIQARMQSLQKLTSTIEKKNVSPKLSNILKTKTRKLLDIISYGTTLTQITEINRRIMDLNSNKQVLGSTPQIEEELKKLREELKAQEELATIQKKQLDENKKKSKNNKKVRKKTINDNMSFEVNSIRKNYHTQPYEGSFKREESTETEKDKSSQIVIRKSVFKRLFSKKDVALKEVQAEASMLRNIFSKSKKREEAIQTSENTSGNILESDENKIGETTIVQDDAVR